MRDNHENADAGIRKLWAVTNVSVQNIGAEINMGYVVDFSVLLINSFESNDK